MNKQPYRKRHLFPRTIDEVVKSATKPLMDKQGKLYGSLLRDWAVIVGAERAGHTRPQRLQWPSKDASGAILHIDVRAAMAPELTYETQQMLEACARHFGYKAIERMVLHPVHGVFAAMEEKKAPSPIAPAAENPRDMMDILQRMRQRIAGDDKRQ